MKISNFKLAIGVPCTFPYIPISFFNSFVMMKKPEFIFIPADNGPIDTLRNDIVEIALKEGVSHLLMMDVDQVYHPDTIPTLLDRKKPVVGAMVCRRYPPFDPVMMRLGDEGYESIPTTEADESGLVEVDAGNLLDEADASGLVAHERRCLPHSVQVDDDGDTSARWRRG